MRRAPLLALLMALSISPAFAIDPGEELRDPAQEARARALFSELRCMVCQNQSIDDSDAPLAKDLRILVRERVVAGDDPDEIKDFLVARYGDFVLLRPRMTGQTALLWAVPFVVLIAGGIGAVLAMRRRRTVVEPLSDEERRRLASVGETEA